MSPDASAPDFSSSSAAFGLSTLHPPSFPAYSEPAHAFDPTASALAGTSAGLNADFPAFGNSNSIDPAVLPLHRGVGHAPTSYSPTRIQPTRRNTVAGPGGSDHQAGGGRRGATGGLSALVADGMSRPRALTLAGLPESFGCFSLINSPASSTASLAVDEGDDEDTNDPEDDEGDDDDDEYRDSSMEDDDVAVDASHDKSEDAKDDPTWAVDSPSFPPAPESHYPSPAFSSYSPTALHSDSLTDLQLILDNDPIPSNAFKSHNRKPSQSSSTVAQGPHLATVPEPDFDFEAFAASIEGGAGGGSGRGTGMGLAPGTIPSYDDLLRKSGSGLFDRYPTPPTDPMTTLPLPTATGGPVTTETNEFDWLNTYTATAEAQQQAREDAAATAAMFSRGFGLDPTHTSSSTSSHGASALGLSLGLPSPPLTAMAMHAHTLATSGSASCGPATTTTANVSSSPHISFPMSAPNSFSNLHSAYASTYPTFSLPSASIVPSPIQTAPVSHPSIAIPASASPATTKNSPSLHDLLAAAWERRQNQQGPTPSSSMSSSLPSIVAPAPPQQSVAQPPPKPTPAFYIPSALHSSASQIGTQTNVDSLAGLVKASGPLSLPIPTWASVVPEL